jgi:hypothetical protein
MPRAIFAHLYAHCIKFAFDIILRSLILGKIGKIPEHLGPSRQLLIVGLSTWQNLMLMFRQVESQVPFGRRNFLLYLSCRPIHTGVKCSVGITLIAKI